MKDFIEARVKGKSITAYTLNLAFHHIIKKVEGICDYNII